MWINAEACRALQLSDRLDSDGSVGKRADERLCGSASNCLRAVEQVRESCRLRISEGIVDQLIFPAGQRLEVPSHVPDGFGRMPCSSSQLGVPVDGTMFHSVFTETLPMLTTRTVSRMSELHTPNTCFGKLGVVCRNLLHRCINSAVRAFCVYVSIYCAPPSSRLPPINFDTSLSSTDQPKKSVPPDPQPAASTCGGLPSPWRRAPASLPTEQKTRKSKARTDV